MKKIILFLCFLCLASLGHAETINLKDGKSVTGKILSRDAQEIKVDVSGAAMTYYIDEIKDIDGQELVQQKAKAVEQKVVEGKPAEVKEDPAQKRILIEKFIDVFGTRKMMGANFDMMLNEITKEKPEEAQKIRERVKVDEIIERLIPLYDKHFTSAELKAYIDFYSSAMGQKLLVHIGEVMKESIDVSAQYMREKFPEEVASK